MRTTQELTEQQQREEDVDEAQMVLSQIQMALADGREALWRLTEALYAFDEIRGWRRLGYDTLGEWLADPEIGMRKSTYVERVATWRKLMVERKVDAERVRGLDPSKVAIVTRAISRGKDAEGRAVTIDEALADAETLGNRDLRDRYQEHEADRSAIPDPATEEKADRSASTVEPEPNDDDLASGQMREDEAATGVGDIEGEVEPDHQAQDIDASERAAQPTDAAEGGELTVMFNMARIDQAEAYAALREIQTGMSSGHEYPTASAAAFRVCAQLIDALLEVL